MQLEQLRKAIAESSGGTSSDVIHAAILNVILAGQLRGCLADFGAGKADLIRLLVQTGRFESITGFDLTDPPIDLPSAIAWRKVDLNQSISWLPDAFDVVVAAGLIEYLENPYAFARELHRVLKPGGTAILTTPNNESWRAVIALVVRGHFVAFSGLEGHSNLTALVQSDFKRILEFAGFSRPRFSHTGSGKCPGLPVSWQAISGGMLRGKRYSDDLVVAVQK